jgi:glycine betaine/proline transport system permease protein
MVIIASMIGAGGLGFDVLAGAPAPRHRRRHRGGLAIVVLAIALDRLSQALARGRQRRQAHAERLARRWPTGPFWRRYPNADARGRARRSRSSRAAGLIPAFADLSGGAHGMTTAPATGGDLVRWINVNFFDAGRDAVRLLLLNLLEPRAKRFIGACPGSAWCSLLGDRRLPLGGCGSPCWTRGAHGLTSPSPACGRSRDGLTVYLCGISVLHRLPDRHPDRRRASTQRRLWKGVEADHRYAAGAAVVRASSFRW